MKSSNSSSESLMALAAAQSQRSHVFYVLSTGPHVGLTSVALGLCRALDRQGIPTAFFKPISTSMVTNHTTTMKATTTTVPVEGEEEKVAVAAPASPEDPSTYFVRSATTWTMKNPPTPIPLKVAEAMIHAGQEGRLLEDIMGLLDQARQGALLTGIDSAQNQPPASVDVADHNVVVVVEGLQATADHPELEALNQHIVSAMDAEVIVVSTLSACQSLSDWQDRMLTVLQPYGGPSDRRVLGCILNKVNEPCHPGSMGSYYSPSTAVPHYSPQYPDEMETPLVRPAATTDDENVPDTSRHTSPQILAKFLDTLLQRLTQECPALFQEAQDFHLMGAIPYQPEWLYPRTCDLLQHLHATVVYPGHMERLRVKNVSVVARTVNNMLGVLQPHTLVITPGDRSDIILAAAMAAMNDVSLAGLILTGGIAPEPQILQLCAKAFQQTGLPLLTVPTNSYHTATLAATLDPQVPVGDTERMERVMRDLADHVDLTVLLQRWQSLRPPRLSPAAFTHGLVSQARAYGCKILLPEGHDPRILKAAAICHERGIAQCVLLGDPEEMHRLAQAQGIDLPPGVVMIQPNLELRQRYVEPMVEYRKHKGLTAPTALAQLEDVSVLATMMLAMGEVDGLVSGATHSTANTVRPALQIIKQRPNCRIISSIFFMCLPNQVLIYGDCAINPSPDAAELADIALQSAASAEAFGMEPRVAMISYSTGTSGQGSDVDKVREATRLVREARPDLCLDGPLQYDAAISVEVAQAKAPHSAVAGRATVLIFPDLNTGNTTYKAVQRTTHCVAIGPMLQGLRRPVNDLSRGALVEDIVYTVALTAIQAATSDTPPGPLPAKVAYHKTSASQGAIDLSSLPGVVVPKAAPREEGEASRIPPA